MMTLPIDSDETPPFVLEVIFTLKVKDVMTSSLLTARPQSSLRDVQAIMKENGVTGVPITDGRRLLGMISVDDIIRALDNGYIEEPAERWMTRNLIVLEDDMPLSFGISYLDKYKFGRFPVLNKNTDLVGILTSRDVIVALLLEANKQVGRLERSAARSAGAAGGDYLPCAPPAAYAAGSTNHAAGQGNTRVYREFRTRSLDFENAGRASLEVKKLLKEAGLDSAFVRRIAVAAYELELNQIVHSNGGTIAFHWDDSTISVTATDSGPGIPDVEQAMQEGYSTATEWIRSLGFGAGMGLPNARKVSDEFDIESSNRGTTVQAIVGLPNESPE